MSKQALEIAKRNPSSISMKTVISFLIGIFGRLKDLSLHSTRRTYCTPISVSKQALEIAKRKLSTISMKTDISFLREIFRRFKALFAPSYTANVVPVDFRVETCPGNRKTQYFGDFDEN
jgi:hypothetical protein